MSTSNPIVPAVPGDVSAGELQREAAAWLGRDHEEILTALGGRAAELADSSVLVTGACGFLGFQFLQLFAAMNRTGRGPVRVTAADSGLRGLPRWVGALVAEDPLIEFRQVDVTEPWVGTEHHDYVIHAASVASPIFYRQFPLETLEANVAGLRHMLDHARHTEARGLLFFSSSEIYGDPPADEIPTNEHYRGNVACIGPRACYDESKRLGETLCYLYAQQYGTPATIARPFNNYGPGLRLADGRVLPDLFRAVLDDRDIVLHSDGTPTRTFCYSSDAIAGYLLVLLAARGGEPFNIGADRPEVSMRELAETVLRVTGSARTVVHRPSEDAAYLSDNPSRRCPDIAKARDRLGFDPKVGLEDGLGRQWEWYRRFVALEDLVGS